MLFKYTSGSGSSSGRRIVGISYSHDNPGHKDWVAFLAKRLQGHGIVVRYDQEDVPLGEDKFDVMRALIMKSDYVLLILTPEYKHKAESELAFSSVKHEVKMILSDMELTGRTSENRPRRAPKFIPVLRLGKPEQCIPIDFGTLVYLDMREDRAFEAQFQLLLNYLKRDPADYKPFHGSAGFFKTGGPVTQSDYGRPIPPEKSSAAGKRDYFLAGILPVGIFWGLPSPSGEQEHPDDHPDHPPSHPANEQDQQHPPHPDATLGPHTDYSTDHPPEIPMDPDHPTHPDTGHSRPLDPDPHNAPCLNETLDSDSYLPSDMDGETDPDLTGGDIDFSWFGL